MKTLLLALALVLGVVAFATPTAISVVTMTETAASIANNSADTSNGNSVANPSGTVFLLLFNQHASSTATVTITPYITSATIPGYGLITKSTPTITLAASQVQAVGPFPAGVWSDASGNLQLTYGGAASTSIKVSPFKLQ